MKRCRKTKKQAKKRNTLHLLSFSLETSLPLICCFQRNSKLLSSTKFKYMIQKINFCENSEDWSSLCIYLYLQQSFIYIIYTHIHMQIYTYTNIYISMVFWKDDLPVKMCTKANEMAQMILLNVLSNFTKFRGQKHQYYLLYSFQQRKGIRQFFK